jgi:L-asparaginase
MHRSEEIVVVLGTGGTIAGTGAPAVVGQVTQYTAAQLGVDALVASIGAFAGAHLQTEQVCQVDSKDMGFALWRTLAERVAHHLARAEVTGVVITHGTDTLEETAYFLQRVLAPSKPVVLAAAMRPATALLADGPQNLLDAVCVASTQGVRGVVAVLAGEVHSGLEVRKVHSHRLTAFSSGDAGVLARVHDGKVCRYRHWPEAATGDAKGRWNQLPQHAADWPWVEIISSHAGADPRLLEALLNMGIEGLVVAGTGNGTVHCHLEAALHRASQAGILIWRSSRCLSGTVNGTAEIYATQPGLTPFQARVELILRLLLARNASA